MLSKQYNNYYYRKVAKNESSKSLERYWGMQYNLQQIQKPNPFLTVFNRKCNFKYTDLQY